MILNLYIKKLEEFEFKESPDTDHYYDESIEVVNRIR